MYALGAAAAAAVGAAVAGAVAATGGLAIPVVMAVQWVAGKVAKKVVKMATKRVQKYFKVMKKTQTDSIKKNLQECKDALKPEGEMTKGLDGVQGKLQEKAAEFQKLEEDCKD